MSFSGSVTTEQLTLEPLTVAHADEMVAVLQDPSLYEFTGGESPTLDGLRSRYEFQIAGAPDPNEIWVNWIIRRNVDGRALGFLQADIVGAEAELAWVVAPEHQGSGIATEAAAAIRADLSTRGVDTFLACIRPEHMASQAVAQRIGLTFTGELDDDGEQIWSSK